MIRSLKKAAAIIGLYLNAPENAAVFCVDEKSAIQALDRRINACRFHPDVPKGMALNTTAMAPYHCMRR
jgi:hypothetical protein